MADAPTLVYIGTYAKGGGEGIYVYELDTQTGSLKHRSTATGIENPTYLALDSQRRFLYALHQVAGAADGAVSAFSIEPRTGKLTLVNEQALAGAGWCHVSVDQQDQHVLVANYTGGSLAVLPILPDGRLGEPTDTIQLEGGGATARQDRPHAHCIITDAANRFAFAADLGTDRLLVYRLDHDAGTLSAHDPPFVPVQSGAGPRHFVFHPNDRYAYLINELDNTIVAMSYDADRGALQTIQTMTTLPEDFDDTSYCAAIQVSPSGKFLYGSNRGHESIVICAIDQTSGMLSLVGYEPTQGNFPRSFGLDPTGTFLLVANQNSNNIVSFRIDQQTGALQPTGHVTQVSMPVCVKAVSLPA
jgi:6-phosphogluconolactonase